MEIKAEFKQQKDVVTRKDFQSRKIWVVVKDNPEYPQTIEIEVQQKNIDLFTNIQPGAPVTVHLNLRGNLWTGTDGVEKCFNTLVCWKVESAGVQQVTPATPLPSLIDEAGSQLPF